MPLPKMAFLCTILRSSSAFTIPKFLPISSLIATQQSPFPPRPRHTITTYSGSKDPTPYPSRMFSSSGSLGGDYAGHRAKFHRETGSLIPIPEYLIPASFIEWGQVPSSLELLTSEDIVEPDEGSSPFICERAEVEIYPAAGCGVDNLDTSTRKSIIKSVGESLCVFWEDVGLGCECLVYPIGNRLMMESLFLSRMKESDEVRRKRVLLTVVADVNRPSGDNYAPVEVISERRTSDTSTRGSIADGGGLDGRTVSRLIGPENMKKPFSEDAASVPVPGDLKADWIVRKDGSEEDTELIAGADNIFSNNNCIFLPGGIIVKFEAHEDNTHVEVSCLMKDNTRVCVRTQFRDNQVLDSTQWMEQLTADIPVANK